MPASAATVPVQPAIANDVAPFPYAYSDAGEVLGIVAIRAVQDRARGTIDFAMRVKRPVGVQALVNAPRSQASSGRLSLEMTASSGGLRRLVGFGLHLGPQETKASYFVGVPGQSRQASEVPGRFSLSSDEKLLRGHITDSRLRASTYSRLTAQIAGGSTSGVGPTASERVDTFFDVPLESLSARLRRGRLTITSAPGARVKVSIRRNAERPKILRYRQTDLDSWDTKLRDRFCPRRARYLIAIRARDGYGNRHEETLRPQRSLACAPTPRPLIATTRDRFESSDARGPRQRRTLDIVALRAEHDRQDGTMLFDLRLARPVPRRPVDQVNLRLSAVNAVDEHRLLARVAVNPRGPSATYRFDDLGEPGRYDSRPFISRDRKRLRVRVKDPDLRFKPLGLLDRGPPSLLTYTHAIAESSRVPYRGRGRRTPLEKVETFFSLPLKRLSLRLRRGRLRIRSAEGAHARVRIRRNGGPPVTVRYRQTPLDATDTSDQSPFGRTANPNTDTVLRYRFSCRRRGTRYAVSVRARDRYGNRRSAKLRKRC
jgi:hypothetical protein